MRNFIASITSVAMCALCAFFLGTHTAFAGDISYALQIPLPGLSNISLCSGGTCDGMAQYVSFIYVFAIRVVIVLGFLWLMGAGYLWMVNRASDARKMLSNALIGMSIALSSYVLLWAINPHLVNLPSVQIGSITGIDFDLKSPTEDPTIEHGMPTGTTPPTGRGTEGIGHNGVPLKKQWMFRGVAYGSCGPDGTISKAGCGPTSLAMVASYYTKRDIPVTETAKLLTDNGYRICGSGTAHEGIISSKVLGGYGLKGERLGSSREDIIAKLNEKKPVIVTESAKGGKCPNKFTSEGHYIVLTGISDDGKTIYVNDPNKDNKQATLDEVFGCMTDALLVTKP